VSPLLPPPFTYREGVLLGQKLRALCLETELEKTRKKVRFSVSVPLVKGDRVGTGLRGLQSVWHVVQVCLEGCYVCEDVVKGSVEPCLVEFLGRLVGGSSRMMDVCWYNVREFHVGWWQCVSDVERVVIRSLPICLVPGHWSKICISFLVACWSQYGHNFWSCVTRCAFLMVNSCVVINWWLWERNLVSDIGLRSVQMLR